MSYRKWKDLWLVPCLPGRPGDRAGKAPVTSAILSGSGLHGPFPCQAAWQTAVWALNFGAVALRVKIQEPFLCFQRGSLEIFSRADFIGTGSGTFYDSIGDENSIPTFSAIELPLLKGLIANSAAPLTYLEGLQKDPKKQKALAFYIIEK